MRLNAFTIGSGERPVVLLHGFLGSGKNLRTLASRWSDADPGRRFLLPDLTGHGQSGPAPDGASLRTLAGDVLETASAEGFDGPVEFVGHSLGGRVSLAASLVAPERVARVTLLDISPSPIGERLSDSGKVLSVLLQAPDEAADRRELRDFLTGSGLSAPIADWLMMNVEQQGGVFRWRFDRPGLQRLHHTVNAEDIWSALEQLSGRARCIRGSRSPYVSDEDARRMQSLGCPVHTLEGAGHFVHVEAFDALLALLTSES